MTDKKGLIFFDFDGVIIDSFWAAFEVSKMIHPLLTEDIYRKRFEGNINENVTEEHIKKEHHPEIDFFKEYEPRILKSRLFPGMKEVLKRLAEEYTIVIISSTISDLIKKYAQLQGIDSYFVEIMGNDVHKSKIKKLEMALEKYAADPKKCYFVTDTLGDIKEAHHVGVKAIAVSWGFQSRETLEQGRPFAIVDTAEELSDQFTKAFHKLDNKVI